MGGFAAMLPRGGGQNFLFTVSKTTDSQFSQNSLQPVSKFKSFSTIPKTTSPWSPWLFKTEACS